MHNNIYILIFFFRICNRKSYSLIEIILDLIKISFLRYYYVNIMDTAIDTENNQVKH